MAAEIELKKQKKKDVGYSIFRLLLFSFALLFFYIALSQNQPNYFFFTGLFMVLFFLMLKKHQKIRETSKELRALIAINKHELTYLDGDLSPFDGGEEFAEASHLYAVDLDIFGDHSLFAHLNRTATLAGKKKLAQELTEPSSVDIIEKQSIIQELSSKLDWRQDFLVNGKLMEENPNLESSIAYWLKKKRRESWILSKWLLYPLGFISVSLLIYWFYETTQQNFYVFLLSFAINLALVFSQMKKIVAEAHLLDNISSSMVKYSKNLKQIEDLDVQNSELLNKLKGNLIEREMKASVALKELSNILSGLETIGNLVVKFITNGLFHYHLHILRQLYRWEEAYGNKMLKWLDTVAEFDKWSSISTFAYNHPSFTYPEISDQKEMEASELGHPFLSSEKRVDNSIGFESGSFMILTGSNMSGKSTFLRAVGVNLVLMQVGSPVCAIKMKAFPFKVLTSMRQLDSLASGESYFQAEILRLRKIKDELDSGKNCFVLLDEILRGTNSDDKRQGTRLFLENISHTNTLGIVATHDVDIADLAVEYPETFTTGYFESKVVSGNLTFDHKLRKGICTTPNAIDLMKAQGII